MRTLCLASIVVASVLVPRPSLALDTRRALDVLSGTYADFSSVGEWRFELDQPVIAKGGYEACRYFVRWVNRAHQPLAAHLWLDELMVSGHMDCAENSVTGFSTLVVLASDFENEGFDQSEQKTTIYSMTLGEDDDGLLSGLLQYNSGDWFTVIRTKDAAERRGPGD